MPSHGNSASTDGPSTAGSAPGSSTTKSTQAKSDGQCAGLGPKSSIPFKPIIEARLAVYPDLTAARLFDEVKAAGYTGGISQLKLFVQSVRPRHLPEPLIRFETEPGEQAQVDFAEFTFPWGKRYALLVVLGCSRLLWLRFYPRQDMRTLFAGLEEAFDFFGGVPRELLFDQMASVITRDLRSQGGRLIENAEFPLRSSLELPNPCMPALSSQDKR